MRERQFALSQAILSFENVKGNDEKLRHLSGLSLAQWEALWKVLGIESKEDTLDRYSATLTLHCHSNTVMQPMHCACARMPKPTSCSCSSLFSSSDYPLFHTPLDCVHV